MLLSNNTRRNEIHKYIISNLTMSFYQYSFYIDKFVFCVVRLIVRNDATVICNAEFVYSQGAHISVNIRYTSSSKGHTKLQSMMSM